ncbi:MAG TPA: hypothetical protein VEJ84_13435 [Acidimicrobiales bacterium]|nr:hypothetical protein [Acidimicrobiales bacterium]
MPPFPAEPGPGSAPAVVEPFVRGGATRIAGGPYGVRVVANGAEWAQDHPVVVILSSGRAAGRRRGYQVVHHVAGGFTGFCTVRITSRTSLYVKDTWTAGQGEVTVSREVAVNGGEDAGFMTWLALARAEPAGWDNVVPFAPGAIYGDSEPVPKWSIGSPQLRHAGVGRVLCREDRLAAPMFAVNYSDGKWMSVLHHAAGAGTTVADRGHVAGGETLIDGRFGFASLGGFESYDRLELGACFPGSEGPVTYSTGLAPLRQHLRWRHRFHPLSEGVPHEYRLTFSWGTAVTAAEFFSRSWRWAWAKLAPAPSAVDIEQVVTASTSVLADQVVLNGSLAGVPLEVDAVTGRSKPHSPAIMGFVGANTDAAYVLLRVGHRLGGATGATYAALGQRVLDSFVRLELEPPVGEGFDLTSGRPTTYRRLRGKPAVFLRSIADGCGGALRAWEHETSAGRDRPRWLAWAQSGGDWLVSAQGPDGSFPRAWEAGTGLVLETSSTASHLPVAFLARLSGATGKSVYLESALRAAEFCWRSGGSTGCFAGATLDNPDVVDKEAAIFALEGFLELHRSTGDAVWLERAITAASIAETWVYAWDLSMPADADPADLDWKPGVPTIGVQLIATGVSTCDGFLAINAAAFAYLYRFTGDEHFLEVARVLTHGTKAMLALPGRTFDLRGPGWQQEHWCLAIPRGCGLTRDWLPWVPVANVEGIMRVEDLDPATSALVFQARP